MKEWKERSEKQRRRFRATRERADTKPVTTPVLEEGHPDRSCWKTNKQANMPPIPPADIISCGSPPKGWKVMCCSRDANVGRETELRCSSHLWSSGAAGQMDWRDLKPWNSCDSIRKSCASLQGAGRDAAARSMSLNSETALPLDAVPAYVGCSSLLHPDRKGPAGQLTTPSREPNTEGYGHL
jgi:hypothetical protein